MKKSHQIVSALTMSFALALSSCDKGEEAATPASESAEASVEVIDVEAAQAAELVSKGEVAVLDVRTPEEYALAHIDGAVLVNIRGEGFEEGVAELDQSKPYLVHCAAGVDGGRSRKAVDALKKAGATKVYHLNGGLSAWMQEDHPTQKAEAE
ncbi:MAG: rhodanese-like domain-containing protein [Verrucomicrobiota bacterium]